MGFLRFAFSCSIFFCVAHFALADDRPDGTTAMRIVGYLPDYRVATFELAAARELTDLVVFSALPTAQGGLDLSRINSTKAWDKFRAFKTRERVRLILCVGGWDRSQHFATIASSAEKRKLFVNNIVHLCLAERLDGIDLDWEHPRNVAELEGYANLLTELHEAFQPHGLVLSVTLAAWQKLPPRAFEAVDTVNIMAYDHEGRHSTLEGARADLKSLLDQSVPANKIVLGVPFYGRHIADRNQALTYAEIIAQHKPGRDVDEIDGLYFNGPATIERKTQLAIDAKLGGVMIWELGQDATGNQSLLKVVVETLGRRSQK